jgi:endonuclease-3
MKNKKEYILKNLEELYPQPAIPLAHQDEYTLLIAVLLSARCTDARVNTITPILFAKASCPKEMIALSVADIQNIIRPCGLSPQKAKAIYNLSHILLEKHGGKVPKSFEDLEELPGVGHKTASVVMAQAFHVPSFPVDTHIHRMMARWGISNGQSVKKTEADAKLFFPKNLWNKVHLQVIYYAREYSPARGWSLEKDFISREIGQEI